MEITPPGMAPEATKSWTDMMLGTTMTLQVRGMQSLVPGKRTRLHGMNGFRDRSPAEVTLFFLANSRHVSVLVSGTVKLLGHLEKSRSATEPKSSTVLLRGDGQMSGSLCIPRLSQDRTHK